MLEFELAGAEKWKPEEMQTASRQLDDYARLLGAMGNASQHP